MAGLYIHVPFCAQKCYYCDFYSMPRRGRSDTLQAYADALFREYDQRSHELGSEPISTVYIGGGTPTSLPVEQLAGIIRHFHTPAVKEFTVEVNPEDVNPHMVESLLEAGADRISMGIQSLDDRELAAVGRRHTAAEALAAFRTLRTTGVENISIDLIYGLPGQTADSFRSSLESALALGPDHLSAYSLTFTEGTRLTAMLKSGRIAEAPQELTAEMYQTLCRACAEAGMEHYEISNFAMPGRRSRHNSSYWDFTPYLGLGAAAHSFDGCRTRRSNPWSIKDYMAAPCSSFAEEVETDSELLNDYILTSLRTSAGLDLGLVTERFGTVEAERLTRLSAPLVRSGRMTCNGSRLRITEEGWLLSDSMIVELIV